MQPETTYVRLGDDRIAYQVLGHGPDLVMTTGGFSQIDIVWEDPGIAVGRAVKGQRRRYPAGRPHRSPRRGRRSPPEPG